MCLANAVSSDTSENSLVLRMQHSGGGRLKGDFEVCVFWVGWDFFDSRFIKIAGKIFFNILYAIIYILRTALGEHLDGTVRHIADEAGQLTATGSPAGGEAKADALNSAGENYTFGKHLSYCVSRISYCVFKLTVLCHFYSNLKRFLVQARGGKIN